MNQSTNQSTPEHAPHQSTPEHTEHEPHEPAGHSSAHPQHAQHKPTQCTFPPPKEGNSVHRPTNTPHPTLRTTTEPPLLSSRRQPDILDRLQARTPWKVMPDG